MTTPPVEKKEMPDQKSRSPRGVGGRRGDRGGLDEGALEREFKNFAIRLRNKFGRQELRGRGIQVHQVCWRQKAEREEGEDRVDRGAEG